MASVTRPDSDGKKVERPIHRQLPLIDLPLMRYTVHYESKQRTNCADAEIDFVRCAERVGVLKAAVDCKKYQDDLSECMHQIKSVC